MLKSLSILVLYLIGIFHLINCGRFPLYGKCPEVKVAKAFDLDRFMGTWYEYARYYYGKKETYRCQQFVYKNEGNDTVSVADTVLIYGRPVISVNKFKAIAPGHLVKEPRKPFPDDSTYLILGTDYDNWAIAYDCKNISTLFHDKQIWILTRERQPNEENIERFYSIISYNHLPQSYLFKSNQTDCPHIDLDDLSEEFFKSFVDFFQNL